MLTKPLVTLEEVKAFCDIRPTNNEHDERLSALALVATKQIENLVRRSFAAQSHTEYLSSRDTTRQGYSTNPFNDEGVVHYAVPQVLYLMGVDVDPDTVELWYDPLLEYGDTTKLVVEDDYEIEEGRDSILVKVPTRFYRNGFKVTYTSGYAGDDNLSAAAPVDLKQACLFQVHFLRVKSKPDNIGMAVERTTGPKDRVIATKFMSTGNLTPEAVALVAHLRRMGTGRG